MFFSFTGSALADSYDNQISALSAQVAAQRAIANQFSAQASDYQSRVNQLNAQTNALQAQINLSQAQVNQINNEIAANEAKLAQEKQILGANLKSMYLSSDVTPLEMVASSNNLSQYFDQAQYQDSIKNKLQEEMASITKTQTDLASQKKAVAAVLTSQQAQQDQVVASRAQVNQLLALASQNAAAANAQVQSTNAQINGLRAAQAASWARLNYSGSSGSIGSFVFKNISWGGACGGGYPISLCGYSTDAFGDQWGMLNRECVSYTAYKVYASGRHMPNWGGRGNAYQWPADAISAGIPVSNTPRVGDVVIAPATMIGGVGHAMYVEQVLSGGWVHVSQYNLWPSNNGPYGIYSEMDLKVVPGLAFIHF